MRDEIEQSAALQDAKALVKGLYAALDAADPATTLPVIEATHAEDHLWRGYHPFHEIEGREALATRFWQPLKAAMQAQQHRLDIFIAGVNAIDGQSIWVASMGHVMGLFDAPWLGIRPTGKIAMLRFAAFHRVDGGIITETAMFFDIPHLMAQAGQDPFGPGTGAFLVQPGPATHDGLCFAPSDPKEGAATLTAIDAMVTDISSWSGGRSEPLETELRRTWHEDMLWWGPHGIGASYTIPRYAKQHSGPFREAFQTRRFNGHLAKIAEGPFGGFFGWPNLTLEHHGGFMGMPATGQPGDMRVIDMYRRRGDKLVENWVFIDLLHFWNMQGVDLLKRALETGRN